MINNAQNNEKLKISNCKNSAGNVSNDNMSTSVSHVNGIIQTTPCTENDLNMEGKSLLAGTFPIQSNSSESGVHSQQSSLDRDDTDQNSTTREKRSINEQYTNCSQAEDGVTKLNSTVEGSSVEIEFPIPGNKVEEIDYSASRCGLRNLGNTCYLNSALQMLYSLNNGFISDLLTFDPNQHNCSSHKKTGEIPLHNALVEIAKEIFCSTEKNQVKEGNIINPAKVKSIIDKKVPQFVGYRQHDSHEFLITLLDLLHEEVKEKVYPNEDDLNKNNRKIDADTRKTKKRKNKKGWRRFSPLFRGGKRVSSFSQLDTEAISDLLHGPNSDENTNGMEETTNDTMKSAKKKNVKDFPPPKSWASIVSSTSGKKNLSPLPPCTLVGGRAPVSSSNAIMPYVHTVDNIKLDDDQDEHKNLSNYDASAVSVETIEENRPLQHDKNDDNDSSVKANDEDESVESKSSFQSFVDSHFCLEIRVTLTCDSCCYSRSKTEMYRHLSIEVGSENDESTSESSTPSSASVEDGIRRFFAPEKREIKCEKCFCESATQTMHIIRLPNALLLHLKRFIVEVSPTYNVTYRKNQTPVEFNEQLNLSEYCAVDVSRPHHDHEGISICEKKENCSSNEKSLVRHRKERRPLSEELVISQLCFESNPAYDDDSDYGESTTFESSSTTDSLMNQTQGGYSIKSVVHHIGSTASCGHYTADVCIENFNGEMGWQRCNDSTITSYSCKEDVLFDVKAQKTAYMIMYEVEI